MKILAAIMDIVHVRKFYRQYRITKIKKFLVYDPKVVSVLTRYPGKEK